MSVAESVQYRRVLDRPSEFIPQLMKAAVYVGDGRISVETIETPKIARGEILVRVESCGICHTDLKKIGYNLLPPPRIYGHETAGTVVATGEGVTRYTAGDRVIVFHHIPCGDCFYCHRRFYAQCPGYKRVGVTGGYEPAGGGFAQYVRVMDWVVDRGVERIPEGVPFDQACWVEPVNTCLKGIELLKVHPGELAVVLGQGPIGLIFTLLAKGTGAKVMASDTIELRRKLSAEFGADAFDPCDENFAAAIRNATSGRGADVVIVAASVRGLVEQGLRIARPGARILLFAQTSANERIDFAGADVCVAERTLLGSYSADVDLQRQSARLVFSGDLPLERLISHRLPLSEICRGIDIARHPSAESLKVVIHPQELS